MNLLAVEIRRALCRRVVRVLILLALLACAFAGVVAFLGSSGKTLTELHQHDELHPAVLSDWWVAAESDGAVLIASFLLLLGGLFGGASVAGAEWRAGRSRPCSPGNLDASDSVSPARRRAASSHSSSHLSSK